MFRSILKFVSKYRIYNPLRRMIKTFISGIPYVNMLKREVRIVVNICADADSFDNLGNTLYSIFNQSIIPDHVILWISNEYELTDLPYSVTKFLKYGLEVRFVDNKKSYTKIIYALKEFEECINVTADADVYYPRTWLSKLYLSYISNPDDIHVHSAVCVSEKSGKPAKISEWKKDAGMEKASYKYFPVQASGVLYPPRCFKNEIFREDVYMKRLNISWDVWSWVIALLSGRKIRLVKNHINTLLSTNIINSFKKFNDSIKQEKNIDFRFAQLFEYYENNISSKLKEN